MQPVELNRLDLKLFQKKLENGLEIYIIPKENSNNIYVTFTTKFGSKHRSFLPLNDTKMVTVPDGVAHFLEHKLFEQENNVDPFTFFVENGADANANTSHHKTTYLFSSSNNFEKNLTFLLNFVQTPYFTDENVEKEKGIIEQEIKMYEDNPIFALYEKSIYNSVVKHPVRIPIAGTIKSINSITKEDLYTCYNTFYHPSNMFVVVTGNVNPDEVLSIIKNNQKDKKFALQNSGIKLKKYNEPDKVSKEKELLKMNIAIPKIAQTYKFNINKTSKLNKNDVIEYILLYFEMKIGQTSVFNEKLKDSNIITENLDYMLVDVDTHILVIIFGESDKYKLLLDQLEKELKNKEVDYDTFERKKKSKISSLIYASDNIYIMNNKITSNIIHEGKVLIDEYNQIKNMDFEEFKKIVEKLNFENSSTVIIKPKNKLANIN